MTNTQFQDGTGYKQNEPLPNLNPSLLEEAVAWAVWDESFDRSNASPELQKMLEMVPSWDQETWSNKQNGVANDETTVCRTSFCIAGYTMYATRNVEMVTLTGRAEIAEHYGWDSYQDMEEYYLVDNPALGQKQLDKALKPITLAKPVVDDLDLGLDPDESYDDDVLWSDGAKVLLGLTEREANSLFNGSNTIQRVQDIAQDIAHSRGLPPLRFDRWTFKKVTDEEINELRTEIHFEETGDSYASVLKEVTA